MTIVPRNQTRDQPYTRLGPMGAITPLVLAVPHAGRSYPAALLHDAAVPVRVLEGLEDRHADRLVAHAVAAGAVAIVAGVARAAIDLNRGEDDLDLDLRDPPRQGSPASARCRAGLGLLPRRIGGRDLWRRPPTPAVIEERIATIHRPYHEAITRALDEAAARHGHALLIDCHSMPPLGGARPARLIVGDLHGRSAAPNVSAAALAAARTAGMATILNVPYAGAFTLARHGRPRSGVHAIQLEVDRSLYLNADMRTLSSGITQTARLIGRIADAALDTCAGPWVLAAE